MSVSQFPHLKIRHPHGENDGDIAASEPALPFKAERKLFLLSRVVQSIYGYKNREAP